MLSLNPVYAEGYRCLGSCLLALGRNGPAIDALRQSVKLGGTSNAWAVGTLAAALAYLGDTEEPERLLAELERRTEDQWVSRMTTGVVYSALGRTDDALTAIEQSFEERDCWVVGLGVEPAWTLLRGQPRFEAIVAKVGLSDGLAIPASAGVSARSVVPAQ